VTRPVRTDRRSEAGFTLIEVLIVLIIITVLAVAAWVAMQSAQVASRNDAMKSAASTIDTAVSTYNRMYPPVGGAADRLLAAPNPWQMSNSQTALVDETGEPLLNNWPKNPFGGNGGVTVTRYLAVGSCANGQPGEIKVCRLNPVTDGRLSYEIRAWGKDSNGAAKLVYNTQHGGR
jgi:prepilin-type N-terminal cleavage/methylation domain-containing protein